MFQLISLLFFLIFSSSNSPMLNFKFKEKHTNNLISNEIVDVIVENNNHTKSHVTEPNDSTTSLYLGLNYIYICGNGCIKQIDTLFVEEENQEIYKTYFLERSVIESNNETEKYHQQLQSYSLKDSLLLINVDSLRITKDKMYLSFSFFNYSEYPIYILRTIECIEPIKIILIDENGQTFKPSAFRIDCVGDKKYPDSSDLIEILPKTKINYPTYHFLNLFRPELHSGYYNVKVIYEYKKPENFGGTNHKNYRDVWKNEIETMTKTLRGKHVSKNYKLKVH